MSQKEAKLSGTGCADLVLKEHAVVHGFNIENGQRWGQRTTSVYYSLGCTTFSVVEMQLIFT